MRTWSKSWASSKKPKKQRKYSAKAPLHVRHKLMSAHLSKELRLKYKKRSFPVRKKDKVKIFTGKFKGVIGEIESVDTKPEISIYLSRLFIFQRSYQPTILSCDLFFFPKLIA